MRPLLHFTLVLLLISPAGAAAQGSSGIAGPVANRLTVLTPPTSNLDAQGAALGPPLAADSVPRDIRPTHWKEGALIGGLSVGVGLAFLADGLCSSDSGGSCGGAAIGGFLLGGLIGGVTGALVGGQFPKESEP
jgi:hypothetical protein